MVMPPRPPKTCPISMSRSVRATSKNVVRKTLIVFLLFYACALAHNLLLFENEAAGALQTVSLHSIRYAPRQQVVSRASARNAWRSEERRVGKEGRSRWRRGVDKNKGGTRSGE